MNSPTIATMDAAGRLVIPKEVRDLAKLQAGTRLQIRYADGKLELEPEPRSVRIVRKGRLRVAVALGPKGASLTAESVRATTEEIRTRRRGD